MGNDRSRCDLDRHNGTNRIIVSQTGITTAATPLIRPGVLEERKVIVKELGQVTIEDTFAIETGMEIEMSGWNG